MYCPSCGCEERQASQYCRACGTDLRPARTGLERPDSITESAVTAREEIGHAIAAKIREVGDARDLRRIVERVLPKIQKFIESPDEKRLRRLRAGVISAAVGLGIFVPSIVATSFFNDQNSLVFLYQAIVMGAVTFTVGLGLVLNGFLFSRPRKSLDDQASEAHAQSLLDAGYVAPPLGPGAQRTQTTSGLARPSVTEHTTHHLKTER